MLKSQQIYFLLLLGFLALFNYFNFDMVTIQYSTLGEVRYMWWDEWLHVKGLLRMQSLQTLELIHPAYTAFYIHLSYLISALLSQGTPIPFAEFVQGSLLASSLVIQLSVILFYVLVSQLTKNKAFALLCAVLFGTHRWVLFHSAVMHPEPPMIFGSTLALIASAAFLTNGKTKMLVFASIGCAIAIASKPQGLLILPAYAGIVLYYFFTHKVSLTKVLKKAVCAATALIISLLILTPYQILHLDKLLAGLQKESQVQNVVETSQVWNWLNYLASNEYLGTTYLLILILGGVLYFFERKNISLVQRAVWVSSFFYLTFGSLYVVLEVNNLIVRYLVHTLPALALLVASCFLLLMKHRYKKGNLFIKLLMSLVLIGGIQQQIKHARLSFSGRETALNEIQQLQQWTQELEQLVEAKTKVAGLNFRFLRDTHFEWTEKYGIFEVQDYPFVILNTHYTGFLEGAGERKKQEIMEFQKILDTMTQKLLAHRYQLVKQGFNGTIKVYQRPNH